MGIVAIIQVILALPSVIAALLKSYHAISQLPQEHKAEAKEAVKTVIAAQKAVAGQIKAKVVETKEASQIAKNAVKQVMDKQAKVISKSLKL